jgi:hypothetical protein
MTMSDWSTLFIVALFLLYVLLKFLKLVEPAKAPKLFFRKGNRPDSLVDQIVKFCPILRER